MSKQADFIKKVQRKPSNITLNLQKLEIQSTSSHQSQSRHYQLRKEDIIEFQVIGIFDKKVIVTFNNRLQLFGYFDFHALHERIRYEYYSWKIKQIEYSKNDGCLFDDQKIQKNSLVTRQIYGKTSKILIKLQKDTSNIMKGEKHIWKWGIEFQRGSADEIFVTSSKQILGKELSERDIRSISQDLQKMKGEGVPKVIDQWIGQFSCKGAYKFNDKLTSQQAKDLIYNLSKCEFPWNCVHGRNTIHVKSMEEIN